MPTVSSPAPPLERPPTASLSVVIPALNAGRDLPPVGASLAEWKRQTGRQPEMLIPDAGGTEAVQFFPWEVTNRVGELKSAVGA